MYTRAKSWSFWGGSGCGKSTLLRHLIGLNTPHAGSIRIQGVDITTCGDAAYRRTLSKIAVLFQGGALFGSMTVAQNVALALETHTDLDRHAIETLVGMKLHMVGLGGFEKHFPSELSGGMKKRARAGQGPGPEPRKFSFWTSLRPGWTR